MQVSLEGHFLSLLTDAGAKVATFNLQNDVQVSYTISGERKTIGPLTPAPNSDGQAVSYVAPTPVYVLVLVFNNNAQHAPLRIPLPSVTNQVGWTNNIVGVTAAIHDIQDAAAA